jgi:hypothetical protein
MVSFKGTALDLASIHDDKTAILPNLKQRQRPDFQN